VAILFRSVSGVGEVVGAFLRYEAREESADALPGGFDGALCGFAQQGFEFGEDSVRSD
jgi:hypothetical protein